MKSHDVEKWDYINTLLNTIRKAKGLKLVSPHDNPYRKIKP